MCTRYMSLRHTKNTDRTYGHLLDLQRACARLVLYALFEQCLNNVTSQVRILVVPEVPGTVRGDVRRFRAVWFNFGRFWRRYSPAKYT